MLYNDIYHHKHKHQQKLDAKNKMSRRYDVTITFTEDEMPVDCGYSRIDWSSITNEIREKTDSSVAHAFDTVTQYSLERKCSFDYNDIWGSNNDGVIDNQPNERKFPDNHCELYLKDDKPIIGLLWYESYDDCATVTVHNISRNDVLLKLDNNSSIQIINCCEKQFDPNEGIFIKRYQTGRTKITYTFK